MNIIFPWADMAAVIIHLQEKWLADLDSGHQQEARTLSSPQAAFTRGGDSTKISRGRTLAMTISITLQSGPIFYQSRPESHPPPPKAQRFSTPSPTLFALVSLFNSPSRIAEHSGTMGWFWADTTNVHTPSASPRAQKPSSCPVPHQQRGDAAPPVSLLSCRLSLQSRLA